MLVAEGAHLDVHQLGQLVAQVLDMHARAAIDMGGEFVGEEKGLHGNYRPRKVGHITAKAKAEATKVSPRRWP
jgi:hypothetical protein